MMGRPSPRLVLAAMSLALVGCSQAEAATEDPAVVAERNQQFLDEVITDMSRPGVQAKADILASQTERKQRSECNEEERYERKENSDMGMTNGIPGESYADEIFSFKFIACVQSGVIDVLPSW